LIRLAKFSSRLAKASLIVGNIRYRIPAKTRQQMMLQKLLPFAFDK
jgi:hypothetical protein